MYLRELQSAPTKLWRSSEVAAAPLGGLGAGKPQDGKRKNVLRKIKQLLFTQRFRAADCPCPPALSSTGTYKVQNSF